jgi:hypothetical protein
MSGFINTLILHAMARVSSLRGNFLHGSTPTDPQLGRESGLESSEDRTSSHSVYNPADSHQHPPQHLEGNFRRNAARNPLPIQLSIHTLDSVVRELVPFFGENCPISVIYNKSPAQMVQSAEVVQATLSTIQNVPDYVPHTRSAFILVG